jgi:hypothetical protein
MADAFYAYSISADTANAKLQSDVLLKEIQLSADITIAIKQIDTLGDALTVVMKAALSTPEKTALDNLVKVHQGEAVAKVIKNQIQHTSKDGLNLFVHGTEFMADPADINGGVTEHDFVLPEDREIEGAMAHVHDHCPGDKMDIEFWMPGDPEVMIGRNGCDVYVPPDGKIPEIRSDSTKPLPAGIILRIRYTCIRPSGTKPRVAVNFRFHREAAT